jgi:hypothetical protein
MIHRPIAAYGAIELPTYFIDVTPFIPLLADGKPHLFTIDVASAEDDHNILQNWYVSGLLQVITDSSEEPTTGKMTVYNAPPFAKSTNTGNIDTPGKVSITVKATRKIHIEADITSGSGKKSHVTWSQDLSYSNNQIYQDNARLQVRYHVDRLLPKLSTDQTLRQTSTGNNLATHNGVPTVVDVFSYPFNVDFAFLSPDQRSCKPSPSYIVYQG